MIQLYLSKSKKSLKIIQSKVLSVGLIWVDFKETRNPHVFIHSIDSLGEPMMCQVVLQQVTGDIDMKKTSSLPSWMLHFSGKV